MDNIKKAISIIICTYNRCESLKDTLDSLLDQECNGDLQYEILIVDNNSKDETKNVVESYNRKFDKRLRYVFESNHGLSYARNKGIEEAEGDIVAFTDDDVIVDKFWLLNIFQCFKKYNCDGMGGRVLPRCHNDIPKWIKNNKEILFGPIVMYDYGEKTEIYRDDSFSPFIGANMAFKKESFNRCGLFKTDIGTGKGMVGEDTEFFNRFKKANRALYYNGGALVWHKIDKTRMNLKYIAKWFIAQGRFFVANGYCDLEENSICYFGVPRSLIREIMVHIVCLIAKLFNNRKFSKNYILIFRNIGMVLEYRRKNTYTI